MLLEMKLVRDEMLNEMLYEIMQRKPCHRLNKSVCKITVSSVVRTSVVRSYTDPIMMYGS